MPTARQLHNPALPSVNLSSSRLGTQRHFDFQPSPLRMAAPLPEQDLGQQANPYLEQNSSGVTELVLTQHSPDAQMLLLPMLAHLSRNNERWITWITNTPINRSALTAYGVETHKIRLVRTADPEATQRLLHEALNTGTSHTVIASLGELNDSGLSSVESAAKTGNSRALLIRYR